MNIGNKRRKKTVNGICYQNAVSLVTVWPFVWQVFQFYTKSLILKMQTQKKTYSNVSCLSINFLVTFQKLIWLKLHESLWGNWSNQGCAASPLPKCYDWKSLVGKTVAPKSTKIHVQGHCFIAFCSTQLALLLGWTNYK